MTQEPDERIKELEKEVARLEGTLEEEARGQELLFDKAIGWSGRLLLGPHLRARFRTWLKAANSGNSAPLDETAGVLAASVERVVQVGLAIVLLVAIPITLASVFYVRHVRLLQTQMEEQATNAYVVQRDQLLATIYDEDRSACEDVVIEGSEPPRTERKCLPAASARARQEAALRYVEIYKLRHPDGTANLSEAPLSGTELVRADLYDLNLSDADLRNANLAWANLGDAGLNGTDLRGASLFNAILSEVYLHGADLRGADLRGADLTDAKLSGTYREPEPDGSGTRRYQLSYGDADLSGANLAGAKLKNADLFGVNLSNADLSGADFSGAEFTNADLSGANLTDANLHGAIFSWVPSPGEAAKNALVTQAQIDSARGDRTTVLPEGLTYPDHWPAAH